MMADSWFDRFKGILPDALRKKDEQLKAVTGQGGVATKPKKKTPEEARLEALRKQLGSPKVYGGRK